MSNRTVFEQLAAIVRPLNSVEADPEAGVDEILAIEINERQREDQQEYVTNLEMAWEKHDRDPVLGEIQSARSRMLAAERDLRLLLAYAREFVYPRPYRLEDLAHAAGMSISGIRTAYDDDEVQEVATRTGIKPRRGSST